MNKTLRLLTFVSLLAGCSKSTNISQSLSMPCDEYGKTYQVGELEGKNCFPHKGYGDPKEISMDIKKEAAASYRYDFPLELKVWIGRNLSNDEKQKFNHCIPCLDLLVQSDEGSFYNWSDYTSIKLSERKSQDYQFKTYDFPSRYTFYEEYQYSYTLVIDAMQLYKETGYKKLNTKLTLSFFDEEKNRKYSIDQKEKLEKDVIRCFDFSFDENEFGFYVK